MISLSGCLVRDLPFDSGQYCREFVDSRYCRSKGSPKSVRSLQVSTGRSEVRSSGTDGEGRVMVVEGGSVRVEDRKGSNTVLARSTETWTPRVGLRRKKELDTTV